MNNVNIEVNCVFVFLNFMGWLLILSFVLIVKFLLFSYWSLCLYNNRLKPCFFVHLMLIFKINQVSLCKLFQGRLRFKYFRNKSKIFLTINSYGHKIFNQLFFPFKKFAKVFFVSRLIDFHKLIKGLNELNLSRIYFYMWWVHMNKMFWNKIWNVM